MSKIPSSYHGAATHRPPKAQRTFGQAFRYAWRGVGVAFTLEPNLRIQLIALIGTLVLAVALHLSIFQGALLVMVGVGVLVLELVNSSLESLADAMHPQYHDKVRNAKDMAAGAVLLSSVAAAVIGALLFVPPLWQLLLSYLSY